MSIITTNGFVTNNNSSVLCFTCQGKVAPFTLEDPMWVTTAASNSYVFFLLPEPPCSSRLTCFLQSDFLDLSG